jgi:SAM-dependent methyltransferase
MRAADSLPRLYREFAAWWPLLSDPASYAEEAAFYGQVLRSAGAHPVHTLLELGSGGGNNASHLKRDFRMTLVDLSPDMLAVSRALNPECTHEEGDMRTIRLGRLFDAVFIHDAIMYLTTEQDLRAALATAQVHCRPGGVVLIAPDVVRETFQPSTDHGGRDGQDRGLRYLEWTWDPDPADSTYRVEFACLFRAGDQVTLAQDRHVFGLFGRSEWEQFIDEAGFRVRKELSGTRHYSEGQGEVFVGVKPGA